MSTETTEAVHNSSSQLWLVAGIPALLVIAFLLYTAVQRANKDASADPAETPASTTQDVPATTEESGK